MYARIGVTYSPVSFEIVKKDSVTDVVNYILSFDEGKAILILAPLKNENGRQMHQFLELLLNQGTSRIEIDGKVERLDDVLKRSKEVKASHKINVCELTVFT